MMVSRFSCRQRSATRVERRRSWNGLNGERRELRSFEPGAELRRLEAEPDIDLARASTRRRAAGSRRSRGGRRRAAGGSPTRSRPAAAPRARARAPSRRGRRRRACAISCGEPGVLDVAFAQAHVRQAPARDPRAAAREPRGAAIDGDHALVERRQQRQQRAFAGADIDRERAAGQQRREQRQSKRAASASAAGAARARSAALLEEPPRQLLALRDDRARSSRGCRRGCTACGLPRARHRSRGVRHRPRAS